MRNLVLFMHQSLDGYCATKDGQLNWIPYTQSLQDYADRVVQTVGSPVYGRITYELMKGYWPSLLNDASASTHEKDHAEWIEGVEKIVVSTTLNTSDWNNTTIIRGNVEEEIQQRKEQEGKDLVIFGSPTLAHSLMKSGLIDELRLTVCPVILGEGKTFIRNSKERVSLELIDSEPIGGGSMALHYKIVK